MQFQVPGRRSGRAPQSRWVWLLSIVLGLWLARGGPGVCPAPRRAGSSHTALPACTGELGAAKRQEGAYGCASSMRGVCVRYARVRCGVSANKINAFKSLRILYLHPLPLKAAAVGFAMPILGRNRSDILEYLATCACGRVILTFPCKNTCHQKRFRSKSTHLPPTKPAANAHRYLTKQNYQSTFHCANASECTGTILAFYLQN